MREDRKLSNKIFGKLSIKCKLIIFIILTIIAITSIYFNNLRNVSKNTKADTNEIQSKASIELKEKYKKERTNKRLEEKCEKGKKLFFDKKYDDAIKVQDEIIKEDEDFYKAYNIKGITLCYKGDFKEGIKNIDKALQINPNYGYARFNKALAYELYDQFDKSLQWYDKALEIEQYEWSYYGKASIYGRRGDVENTVKYLKRAIEISPGVKEEAKHEEDFNPVRNSEDFKKLVK